MTNTGKVSKIHRRVALGTVFVSTLMALLALFCAIRFGVTPLEMATLLGMHMLCIIGVEMGFHRYFSHRSFKINTFAKILLVILGSMAAQGPLVQWVCDHRKHHRFTDSDGDPHSPHSPCPPGVSREGVIRKLWHSHIGWLFERELHDPTTYGKDLLRDPLLLKISRYYHLWVFLGILLPGIFLWMSEGMGAAAMIKGMLYGGGLRIFLGHHAVWSVNSFGHYFGSRPFNTRERSRNNLWLVLPTLGGGWHNNHHANPASAINSMQWWQIDPIGMIILLLGRMKVIHDIRRNHGELVEEHAGNITR